MGHAKIMFTETALCSSPHCLRLHIWVTTVLLSWTQSAEYGMRNAFVDSHLTRYRVSSDTAVEIKTGSSTSELSCPTLQRN